VNAEDAQRINEPHHAAAVAIAAQAPPLSEAQRRLLVSMFFAPKVEPR
jgi:hypothetical protein